MQNADSRHLQSECIPSECRMQNDANPERHLENRQKTWDSPVGGWGLGFRVQGSRFRVQGSGFRVQGSGVRGQGAGFMVQGGAGCRV